jgi:hypothetical protein
MDAVMTDGNEYRREAAAEICAVPRELVPRFWPMVRQWVAASLEHSVMHELHSDEVYWSCYEGSYLLLVMRSSGQVRGCAVLAKSTDPQGRPYLGLICCGGERVEEWLSVLVAACKLVALEHGAREIVVMGRPGWQRLLKPHGLRLRGVILVLDLEGERDG